MLGRVGRVVWPGALCLSAWVGFDWSGRAGQDKTMRRLMPGGPVASGRHAGKAMLPDDARTNTGLKSKLHLCNLFRYGIICLPCLSTWLAGWLVSWLVPLDCWCWVVGLGEGFGCFLGLLLACLVGWLAGSGIGSRVGWLNGSLAPWLLSSLWLARSWLRR
jgi:hypothetical protein